MIASTSAAGSLGMLSATLEVDESLIAVVPDVVLPPGVHAESLLCDITIESVEGSKSVLPRGVERYVPLDLWRGVAERAAATRDIWVGGFVRLGAGEALGGDRAIEYRYRIADGRSAHRVHEGSRTAWIIENVGRDIPFAAGGHDEIAVERDHDRVMVATIRGVDLGPKEALAIMGRALPSFVPVSPGALTLIEAWRAGDLGIPVWAATALGAGSTSSA